MKRGLDEIQMGFYQHPDEAAARLPVSVEDWENLAREKLAAGPYDYVAGSAGGGSTMRANLAAFDRWQIRPRVCTDVTRRHIGVTLFGKQLPAPFLLAPIGVLSILHPDAELGPARAAAKAGIPYILSNVSTTPMEEVAAAMGESHRWFQLYPPKDRDLTRSLLERAEKAGYSAVVVTLDSTLLGWRERDLRNGYLPFLTGQGMGNYFSDPVFLSKLEKPLEQDRDAAVRRALAEGNNTCFTWSGVDFIREQTRLPVLLKGLTHPEDAALALKHGVDGLIVSNHGGRQLDGAIATLDALPEIVATVKGRVPILMDSGIRRGADVIKALALGADAVLLGRPYAYALAVAGELGVTQVIEALLAQIELQLAISGRSSVRDLDPSLLARST
ncbi:MAG: alpha-hydroxy-acid oxidizing protein [Bacillota bacterium]